MSTQLKRTANHEMRPRLNERIQTTAMIKMFVAQDDPFRMETAPAQPWHDESLAAIASRTGGAGIVQHCRPLTLNDYR